MSYGDGEAAILTLVRGVRGFNRANSSRGDWKPLNSGASASYVVLKPGAFSASADGLAGESLILWRTVIEVWQRWQDDTATLLALEARVADVIGHMERYPTLDGVCLLAQVAGGSEMTRRWVEQGGPLWAVQEVYIDWQEERFYSSAESAD